jgi:outer membrane murein-binding lipoprotein Lpp
MRFFAAILACLLLAAPLSAQKAKRDPFTQDEVDQIKDAGTDPAYRISLFNKFLDQRAQVVKTLGSHGYSASRNHSLDSDLQDLVALMDELGDDLDEYGDRHADLLRALKPLTEDTPRWMTILRGLPSDPAYDLSRKDAIESLEDLTDQAARLLTEQTAYFKAHPDEKGQQRAEPK